MDRFIGPPKPLNMPITTTEVAKAVGSMENGKAWNGVAAESIKYGSNRLQRKIAQVLNNTFSEPQDIDPGSSQLTNPETSTKEERTHEKPTSYKPPTCYTKNTVKSRFEKM